MALFRRSRRLGRRLAAASGPGRSPSGSSVSEASEEDAFQDPPRHWGRVGALAGIWALVLLGGAWFAPGFASGGGNDDVDPRDQAATDAPGAALRYLRFSSNGEMERAEATLCNDASPELTPTDIRAIRDEYSEALGGLSDIDFSYDDPVPTDYGIAIDSFAFYISEGQRRSEDFIITVQENDGEYCVLNASRSDGQEEVDEGATSVEPETLASEYLTQIFRHRDLEAAEGYQCSGYSGIKVGEVEAALVDWEAINGDATAYLEGLPTPTEEDQEALTVLEAEVRIDGLMSENFIFEVVVQEDCIASLNGGEDLIDTDED